MIEEQNELRELICVFNDSIDKLLASAGTLFCYNGAKCSGGQYSPYKRAIYKPESVEEYEYLKDKYRQLDQEYLSLLEAIANSDKTSVKPKIKLYKNSPVFFGDNVTHVSLTSTPAHKSINLKSPDEMKSFIAIYEWFYKELIESKDFERIYEESKAAIIGKRERIISKTNGVVRPKISDDGFSISLTITIDEIFDYAATLGDQFSSITLRRMTGKKYMARVVFSNEPSEKHKFGMFIVHPDSPIRSSDITELPKRIQSRNALNHKATQLSEIGGELITTGIGIWLVR
ncbi:hypothetical protein P3687_22150 [Vibrio parahaemolyticus]|nr:hypothetical protein [Vibrio parahaemolyticus]